MSLIYIIGIDLIMDITEILGKALKISTNLKYKVIIDKEIKEMTYLELGLLITSNSKNIDKIEITMRKE